MNKGIDLEREKREQDGTEYRFGALSQPSYITVPLEEREQFFPVGELQFGKEDFMDCVTRSYLDKLETDFNYAWENNLFNKENMKWLAMKGYVLNGKITFSDRFIAVKSNTTRTGNSLKAPAHTVHNYGLIPKLVLPSSSDMTFDDYHNPESINNDMITLGREFRERFNINYEQVKEIHALDLMKEESLITALSAWPVPVDGVYPRTENNINHSVLKYKPNTFIFDHYLDDGKKDDYIKQLAPDFIYYDYDYRIFISKETTEEERNIELTVLQTLFKKGLLAFFSRFMELFQQSIVYPTETSTEIEIPEPKQPTTQDKIKEVTLGLVGFDLSTVVDNNLACVETVSRIVQKVYPDFPLMISTIAVKEYFKTDKRFRPTLDLTPWSIILCVTGTGNGKIKHGHIGILGENGLIYSNSSLTGRFEQNYTVDSWVNRYRLEGGYRVYIYTMV